jgi:CheY-like chemotaxis protein
MGARIIIIDNDQSIRKLLLHNLEGRGYEVLNYDYAHIALTDLEQLHPNLILLDFNIRDGGRGWDFLQMLKMDDVTAKIPIIIISTALHFSAELDNYLSMRFIHVVNKPFEIDAFVLLVQKTLMLANQAGLLFSSDRILPILVVDDSEALREAVTTLLGF